MNQSYIYNNTFSLIAHNANETPNATAIEAAGRLPLSYAGLFQNILGMVIDLQAAGIHRKDRVAIVLPNGPEMAITLLGVSATAVCAPLNPVYQEHEFKAFLSNLNVKLLITRPGFASSARMAATKMKIPVIDLSDDNQNTDSLYSLISVRGNRKSPDIRSLPDPAPDDIAIVLHTSGTTSRPKIVPLSHRNICVSVNYVCQSLLLNPRDRCLSMMPQFHIGGFVDLLLAPLASGGCLICTDGFDAKQFFRQLVQYRPTWYQAVPSTLSDLMIYAEMENIDPMSSSLRFIRSVAAPLSPKMMATLEAFFGVPVIQTFGMTEAAPLITTNLLPPGLRKPGSSGPSIGPEVEIMDSDGHLLTNGEIGEVVVRGDNVLSGYENHPEANAQAFTGGWFHTGDLGYLDEDRYLFLTGRLKEIINRGGEKISPEEIDEVLLSHPAVAEAVCFSIPHTVLGEDVAAAVVPKNRRKITANELTRFASERLAIFKVPKTIFFVKKLPKGATGKIQRIGLAKRLSLKASVLPNKGYAAPQTLVEKIMTGIWAEVFRCNQVGIYDNFFEMGGDSLQVVKLFLKIEKRFHITLPLNTIFRFPSISELSDVIEKNDKDPGQKIFESIRQEGRNPVFWIHCRFEFNGLPLIPLATFWEKNPEKDIKGITIEEMAAGFVDQIRQFMDTGPYFIGGFSIGGLIALEAARQLKNTGQAVPFLFLSDPAGFGSNDKNFSTVVKIFRSLKIYFNLRPKNKVAYIKRKILNFFVLSNFGVKNAICRYLFKNNKPLPHKLRMYYANRIFSEAIAEYKHHPYPGSTSIYLSKLNYASSMEKWQWFCPNAEIYVIDTDDHIEMVTHPWSDDWLKDIGDKLAHESGVFVSDQSA